MDALIASIILGIPNFAVAIWAINHQNRTITKLLAANERLSQYIVLACGDDVEALRLQVFDDMTGNVKRVK